MTFVACNCECCRKHQGRPTLGDLFRPISGKEHLDKLKKEEQEEQLNKISESFESLAKDEERLEWLAKKLVQNSPTYRLLHEKGLGWRVYRRGYCPYPHKKTFREAIDASMELEKQTKDLHKNCGRSDQDGPLDPDCTCRGTVKEKQCAGTGCGFCMANRKRRGKRG